MKETIKGNLGNPEKLEQLYRDDSTAFESEFRELYTDTEKSDLMAFWKIRLDYQKLYDKVKGISLTDIVILVSVCLVTGLLIKIPYIFKMDQYEIFYTRNTGMIVFFGLTLYTVLTSRMPDIRKLLPVAGVFLILTVYVNLLPSVTGIDSINLVCIHLPLMIWSIFGIVFINFDFSDKMKWIGFIRYNGDLAILMALMVIAGGILTGITIGLFEAIGIKIEKFYFENVVIVGAVSVPIVATLITRKYTILANRIAPIIATIFSPLVLLTAIVFLVALAVSGKDPYTDRDFLLMFNIMLVGVMAVIVFSISETSTSGKQKFTEMVLFSLSVITVIIDLIALSAIFYRLGAYGITPNRLAVLGSNILILGNLSMIIKDLYKVNFRNVIIQEVELTIAKYLPVYLVWIIFVVFGFPLIFGIK